MPTRRGVNGRVVVLETVEQEVKKSDKNEKLSEIGNDFKSEWKESEFVVFWVILVTISK